ncbi:MAG: DUF2608 domain-containing protein [Lysobacterales bacterium]
MDVRFLRIFFVVAIVAVLSACAAAPAQKSGGSAAAAAPKEPPPPAQNLLGTTDELQLITELSLDLAGKYGGSNVLVALDIDNTLLAMEQDLGSDQWYYWQKDMSAMHPCSDLVVGDRNAAMGAIFFASAMRPTQPNAADQVRRMQEAGVRVIALTSRGVDYRLSTFRELRRNGFSFWPSAWPPQRGFTEPLMPEGFKRPVVYEDGVEFVSGQDKGAALKALLDRSGAPYPTLIVAVDDKQENLNTLMRAFSWSGTKIQAWRYTREDDLVKAFSPSAAGAEWKELRPALMKIQEILGPDNYNLPANDRMPGCG